MNVGRWIAPVVFAIGVFFVTRVVVRSDEGIKSQGVGNGRAVAGVSASPDVQGASDRRVPEEAVGDVRLLPPILTFRQKTLKDYGHQGVSTWSAIDQAESSLAQITVEGMIGGSPFLPIDCFEGGEDWSEFSYSLSVISTKHLVTVGGFRVENSSMPGRVSLCLEGVFAGESTVESAHQEGFLEFETRLERSDSLVQGMMFAVKTRGREEYLGAIGDAFDEHRSREVEREQQRRSLALELSESSGEDVP